MTRIAAGHSGLPYNLGTRKQPSPVIFRLTPSTTRNLPSCNCYHIIERFTWKKHDRELAMIKRNLGLIFEVDRDEHDR